MISTSIGATLSFTDSNFTGNQCIQTTGTSNSANGGGLYNQNSTFNITRCNITGNASGVAVGDNGFAGGLRALGSAAATITNIIE